MELEVSSTGEKLERRGKVLEARSIDAELDVSIATSFDTSPFTPLDVSLAAPLDVRLGPPLGVSPTDSLDVVEREDESSPWLGGVTEDNVYDKAFGRSPETTGSAGELPMTLDG